MAQTNPLTREQIRALIDACFGKLAAETEANALVFGDPAREVHEQRRMIDERLQELRSQIRSGRFEADVEAAAASLVHVHGFDGESLSPGLKRDLLEGVARALTEEALLLEFRLTDRLMPYSANDPLFAEARRPFLGVSAPGFVPTPEHVVVGPTVLEAVDRYMIAKRKTWVGKTHVNRRRQLDLLVEHLGGDRRLRLVTTDQMRTFRDGLVRLRRKHHVGASMSFIGRQTDNDAMRIDPKTAMLQLQNSRTFLRWAVTEGYLEKDPSAGLRVELLKATKAEKRRRPFKEAELAQLFGAPTFRGCKSPRRRHEPGAAIIRDAQYWLPLLGYLTGARLGELVQLHADDVDTAGPIPFIQISESGGGEVGSGTEKHVKSVAGVRRVPIHPHLIELGFLDFVRKRSKDCRASRRLFFEIAYGRDGQASTTYSKRFARLLDKIGLTDPALVFHSFRHNAEDALRNSKEPQYLIDRVIGHADEAVSAQYGQGISLQVAAAAIASMQLPLDVRAMVGAA